MVWHITEIDFKLINFDYLYERNVELRFIYFLQIKIFLQKKNFFKKCFLTEIVCLKKDF